jgi:tetratricopeptide (TPR) repeat protein
LARGIDDFAAHYETAARKQPGNPNIPAAHCQILEGSGQSARAADIAARARLAFPQIEHFSLLEALHAGSAGQWDRAEAIFQTLRDDSAQRHLHEARHRLREGAPERAEACLQKALEREPWDIGAWALRGLAWRALGDKRGEWLHEQAGLVAFLPLKADAGLLDAAEETLQGIHQASPFPLGQSLRGGTQTRGNLFDMQDPIIRRLRHAIYETLADYRAQLPACDANHPLLRHRDETWRFDGSWSVRLNGGGDHHVSHIHPAGIISSALYLIVPPDAQSADHENDGSGNGWLEIGRPPANLSLDLSPLRTIRPERGHLALFPSTLYHGTTRFTGEERMTVAFDVIA